MRTVALIIFPGSNCDCDTEKALRMVGARVRRVSYKERDLGGVSGIILPGGFSYGDYLRAGAIASCVPIMEEVRRKVKQGVPLLAICNGFQIATQASLLPGVLLPNDTGRFICRCVSVRIASESPYFTSACSTKHLSIPIAHKEGRFYAPVEVIKALREEGRIALTYTKASGDSDNPNGSCHDIAGIYDKERRILGMMPHPERAMGGHMVREGGRGVLESFVQSLVGG